MIQTRRLADLNWFSQISQDKGTYRAQSFLRPASKNAHAHITYVGAGVCVCERERERDGVKSVCVFHCALYDRAEYVY